MADNERNSAPYFHPVDVSQPTTPRKEIDIIEEQLALRRRNWIKVHINLIYAVIGVALVALIFVLIHMYNHSTNPMSRLVSASAKDIGTPFDFEMTLSENDEAVMRYSGSVDIDRATQEIAVVYDAQYPFYDFRGVVYADAQNSVKGSYYDGRWSVTDCTERVQDFFDFDTDFRRGEFDAGSFLRFVGLTSDYSASELSRYVGLLRERLSTNSEIASYTSEKKDGGTVFDYTVDLYSLFRMVEEDGAPLFYRSTDYDRFKARFDVNEENLKNATCTMHYLVDESGYLSEFAMTVSTGGVDYALDCRMSGFGETQAAIPDDFFEAASVTPTKE